MTTQDFEKVVDEQLEMCRDVLVGKSKEYSNCDDKLIAFKRAAALESNTQEQALFGMLAKHFVSIADLCKTGCDDEAKWTEKITDTINYLLLLKGIIVEKQPKGWDNVPLSEIFH